jgi:hypothetical protein
MLVYDLAARAATAGAWYVEVTANPNALGGGSTVTGEASTRFGSAPHMTLGLLDVNAMSTSARNQQQPASRKATAISGIGG